MQYDHYKILFEEFYLQNPAEIRSFSMSDDPRVLNNQVSKSAYPQLQLDLPVISPRITHGGRHHTEVQATIAILQSGGSEDDWISQETALEVTYPIIEKLVAYLDYKRKTASGIKVLRIGQIYGIVRYENNLWGWGISVTLDAPASFCHDPDQDVEILHFRAAFVEGQNTLQIEVQGDTYSVTLTESSRLPLELENIASAITSDDNDVTAYVFDNRLALVASDPADPAITYNISLPGHTWTQISLDS